jgi:REP element-mobilizing transposase RayT
MPLPERKQLPHEIPAWVSDGAVYFFTMCAAERGDNIFTVDDTARILINAAKHYHGLSRWFVHLFLVMPDHVHGLFSFSAHEEMRKVVSSWKSFTAKATGIRWQRDFFEHRLRAEESFDVKSDYIRKNPVRAKLCDEPGDWPHIWPR